MSKNKDDQKDNYNDGNYKQQQIDNKQLTEQKRVNQFKSQQNNEDGSKDLSNHEDKSIKENQQQNQSELYQQQHQPLKSQHEQKVEQKYEQQCEGNEQQNQKNSSNQSQKSEILKVNNLKPLHSSSSILQRKYKQKYQAQNHLKTENLDIEIKNKQSNNTRPKKERSYRSQNSGRIEKYHTNDEHNKSNLQNKDKISNQEESQINASNDLQKLAQENNNLQLKNKKLLTQLKLLSSKVDNQIQRRRLINNSPNNRKPRVPSNEHISQNIELKSAMKQIDIYKKEVEYWKKKQSYYNQQAMNNLVSLYQQYKKQNEELKKELKTTKKSVKDYERMIGEIGDGDYLKLREENKNLVKNNRALRQKLQDREIQQKIGNKQKETKLKKTQEKPRSSQLESVNPQIYGKKSEESIQRMHILLRNKSEKDGRQIKNLTNQNNKLKELITELKDQNKQKDRQIQNLKQLVRKQYKSGRLGSPSSKSPKNMHKKSFNQNIPQQSAVPKQISKNQTYTMSAPLSQYQFMSQASKTSAKKWNHHIFSSKLLQVHVMAHPNGHIEALHFVYQLGEPNKIVENGRYAVFACSINGNEKQYIRQVRGGFRAGLLAYLKLKTNKGRQSSFCMHQLDNQEEYQHENQHKTINQPQREQKINEKQDQKEDKNQDIRLQFNRYAYNVDTENKQINTQKKQNTKKLEKNIRNKQLLCQKFRFGGGQNEYVMGFFGQNIKDGIIRLGCFVGRQSNNSQQNQFSYKYTENK